jgi:hypothetical protein
VGATIACLFGKCIFRNYVGDFLKRDDITYFDDKEPSKFRWMNQKEGKLDDPEDKTAM